MTHRQPGNPARCKSTSDDTSGVRVHTTIAFDLSVLPESKDQMFLKEWQSIRVEPTVDAPICFAKFPVVLFRLMGNSEFVQLMGEGLIGIHMIPVRIEAGPIKLESS